MTGPSTRSKTVGGATSAAAGALLGWLNLRLWALAALALVIGELVTVGMLWNLGMGLDGDRRAFLFVFVAVVLLGVTGWSWPRRSPG